MNEPETIEERLNKAEKALRDFRIDVLEDLTAMKGAVRAICFVDLALAILVCVFALLLVFGGTAI